MGESWRHFSHGADIGVRGEGDTVAQAFQQAGVALTAVITDPASVSPAKSVEIACEAPDIELLFVDWLNALVYHMATRKMLFSRYELTIEGQRLHGQAWGEPLDRDRHSPAVEVKGATYTALTVSKKVDNGWIAQCVVDV